MMAILRGILLTLSCVRLIPHLVIVVGLPRDDHLRADINRWAQIVLGPNKAPRTFHAFVRLMTFYPEFRNVFYYRTGWKGKIFSPLCHQMPGLQISTGSIGPGLFIQHGIATIIAARKIGKSCWINQQVTIGFSNVSDCPTLGDNVTVCAGAKIIGDVTVGDNSVIGANAVVVKDVPPDVTVVGVPAYIVKRNGMRVRESL
jgi:serine O-acetyltransferase